MEDNGVYMKKIIAICFLSICPFLSSLYSQQTGEMASIIMMNQEIRHTLEENSRQRVMRKKETENLTLETANKEQWTKVKKVVKKIQSRLSVVDFAVQGIPTGIVITRKVKKIKNNQKAILKEIKDLPPNLIDVVKREIAFAKDVEMVSRLLIGLVASYGIINQMEKAERKILLDYALKEVERIEKDSSYTLFLIRDAKMVFYFQKMKFKYYINRDRELIMSTMRHIKNY